jgi:hypothetical protein
MCSVADDIWISVVLEAHVHGLSARFPAVMGRMATARDGLASRALHRHGRAALQIPH